METFDAIRTRRSVGKVKDDPVPKSLIEKILEAATYAPNHYRTEPWRFFVLSGESRKELGEVLEGITRSENIGLDQEKLDKKAEKSRNNPLRAPVIIAVGVEPSDKKNVIQIEEYAAVHSAIQNMLLTAHALELGAIWRTGAVAYHTKVKEFFGLTAKGELAGFIYLGYPDMNPKTVKKTGYKNYTVWMD
ncbi:nitroreductase family protein [Fictibacillus barbaricus]|uniref:Putative NAD(P)H nitroreductase n=1 Tax=Fictibacillus barbaricus TaxID=182136 RepID=A0ABS2ZB57_9BACL|nr:nitroreductase [Fictibacillus barbaricus]MBN3544887.1 nitroreductase [Fictibacillus barbaricus]GGB63328.1 putative NAD(P)H nitroreductase YfhC [Fictibacillus barbaricus]